jgi:REP element-mobilizing transposase RayT
MRVARVKLSPIETEAVYHCMTRTVNGERLFDDTAKETLRKHLWLVADYCGVQILTYAILSNHFHVLVKVPQLSTPPADDELLRRYAVLYPKPTKYQIAQLEVIKEQLKAGGEEGIRWRQRQLALMSDVSQFMKLAKQRFATWYNKTHRRYGTLWSERFKSVLVEPKDRVIETMALYIDLNCVRAGLVEDPKDYRFCGYGEAVAAASENHPARRGIGAICGAARSWAEVQSHYREALFGTGSAPRAQGKALSAESFEQVLKRKGRLPLSTVLRCRVRYFSDGVVLGSQAYVQEKLSAYTQRHGRREKSSPHPLKPIADWGDLTTLRGLRTAVFG